MTNSVKVYGFNYQGRWRVFGAAKSVEVVYKSGDVEDRWEEVPIVLEDDL